MDESNLSQSYIAVEDGSNVSTNSIEEILNFSQRQAANQSIIEERLVNEYDHESDPDIIDDTEDEEDEEEEEEEEEDDFRNRRAKIPRLHSNLDLKETAKEATPKKVKEEIPEEEVFSLDFTFINTGTLFFIFSVHIILETCSICFEPWTNSGEHRLVCLKCGHLFGENCIERWVKTNPKCPQCNMPAKKQDIRKIYAKAVKCLDTVRTRRKLKK